MPEQGATSSWVVEPNRNWDGQTIQRGRRGSDRVLLPIGVGSLLGMFGLVALGAYSAYSGLFGGLRDQAIGYMFAAALFLGICAGVLLPNAFRDVAWIELRPDGFRAETSRETRNHPWSDVLAVKAVLKRGKYSSWWEWHVTLRHPGEHATGHLTLDDATGPSFLSYPACPRVPLDDATYGRWKSHAPAAEVGADRALPSDRPGHGS